MIADTQKLLNERLYKAIQSGNKDVVSKAIADGADVDYYPAKSGATCLIQAIRKKNPDMVKLLLEAGADPNARGDKTTTPILAALKNFTNRTREMMDLLLDYGIDPNIAWVSKEGGIRRTPLHHFAKNNQQLLMEQFLEAGADPLIEDVDGKTPQKLADHANRRLRGTIQKAMALPRVEITPSLRKADLFAANGEGFCPLDNPATWRSLPQIVQMLEKNGETLTKEDFQREDFRGKPFIRMAVKTRMLGAVKELSHARGESLLMMDVMPEAGLDQLMVRSDYVLREIFNPENLKFSGMDGLRASLRCLPSQDRASIPNLHRLVADVKRQETVRNCGRGM